MEDPRVVKSPLPLSVIFSAVAIGLLVLGFVIYAVAYSGTEILDAKKTGIIVKKEFEPAPEEQLTLKAGGTVTASHVDGKYILTVEVPQKDGTKKPYFVWLDKKDYDAVNVGDSYSVGAYLVPEKKEK